MTSKTTIPPSTPKYVKKKIGREKRKKKSPDKIFHTPHCLLSRFPEIWFFFFFKLRYSHRLKYFSLPNFFFSKFLIHFLSHTRAIFFFVLKKISYFFFFFFVCCCFGVDTCSNSLPLLYSNCPFFRIFFFYNFFSLNFFYLSRQKKNI